jgi:hypothetical protein
MNEITVFFQKWQLDERGMRERRYLVPNPREGGRWYALWLLFLQLLLAGYVARVWQM